MKSEIAKLKERQLELQKAPTMYHELIPATQELNTFKMLKAELVAARMPITKRLDELKASLLGPEKEMDKHIKDLEENIRKIKVELKKKQDEANALIQKEKEEKIQNANNELSFIREFKTICDSALDYWATGINIDEKSYIEKVNKKIEKLNGSPAQIKEAKETFRNIFIDTTMNEPVHLDGLVASYEKKQAETILSAIATPEAVFEGTEMKEIHTLDMPDDWETLKSVLMSWLSNFDEINSGLRNQSVFSIQIKSVVSQIEKNCEKYKNLKFKKEIK
mgnify:CR=1 FL=1